MSDFSFIPIILPGVIIIIALMWMYVANRATKLKNQKDKIHINKYLKKEVDLNEPPTEKPNKWFLKVLKSIGFILLGCTIAGVIGFTSMGLDILVDGELDHEYAIGIFSVLVGAVFSYYHILDL